MACFIGFGSLVNTATHKYQPLAAVRVPGWSRAWINNDLYDHAFLSVVPQAEQSILGLLAAVPDKNWGELDQREAGYDRKPMEPSDWQITVSEFEPAAESGEHHADVQMYVHASGDFAQPDKPILYSYLETVLFGFYKIYGSTGVDAFIESTTAWTVIKDDRAAPLYPRHVPPQGQAVQLVEAAISRAREA